MLSAHYYREQAQLLISWALAASDPDHVTQLTARAIELLQRSMNAEGGVALDQAIMEFNNEQMRPRPAQQQQQRQQAQANQDDPTKGSS